MSARISVGPKIADCHAVDRKIGKWSDQFRGNEQRVTYMFPVAAITELPSTGPIANPTIMIPDILAKTVALDPSGVVSLMYALTVAVIVENPPSSPSSAGPMRRARYPPGA
jgi:hypothetical protein